MMIGAGNIVHPGSSPRQPPVSMARASRRTARRMRRAYPAKHKRVKTIAESRSRYVSEQGRELPGREDGALLELGQDH